MPEYLKPDCQHNVDDTHNRYVRQTVQSPPSNTNNILNTYTTRRDYMAYLRKQKSPWNHWQKIFDNYLGNFKANLTKMATKMQKSFDDNNRVLGPNYQPQKAIKTAIQIKNRQHIRTNGEGLDNGSDKQLRENLNGAANNAKNFFNYIGKGTRNFGNSVMDALKLRDSRKLMLKTMAKGHQAAKKVRNYLENPRGQNKEQDPKFSQGFSNFIHHPREAVHKAAHQAKYGFTALQNSESNSPQKGINFKTLQTPKNGVNFEGRVNTYTQAKSGDVAPTVPHANVPRINNISGPVVETHVSANPAANYEELAQQDAQREYLEQQAKEAEPEQSKLDERNDCNIEAHKIRKQAKKNTTPVNNTPNEPNANMDSANMDSLADLADNFPPDNADNFPHEPEPDTEPDF